MIGKILIISFSIEEAKKIGKDVGSVGYPVMGISATREDTFEILSVETPDLILLDGRFIPEKKLLDLAVEIEEKYGIPYYLMLNPTLCSIPVPYNSLSAEGIIKEDIDTRMVSRLLQSFFSTRRDTQKKETVRFEKSNKNKRQVSTADTIIGKTAKFKNALELADQVAETDASVLILGETGTGKELFAKYIHEKSLRKSKKMVSLNCAAIPDNLIESELFGHEKGSFTGAFEKRIGKFQLAHRGSIFLDEIGELPRNSQAKFLRFLQEKEIDTIGGIKTEEVDVRVIAATNRNLRELVTGGSFRTDLYFRLNTFPIIIPPLRERKDDIYDLAHFFLERSAEKMGKVIDSITDKTLNVFRQYDWPGNIRELENVIERGAIICTSNTLEMKPSDVYTSISARQIFDVNCK